MADNQSEDGNPVLPDCGDAIDPLTFEQILEMDEEDDPEREFSRSIVLGFFEQAESTFVDMDEKLQVGDLESLSSLGHFLKGSSATLGLTKVKDHCEKIQHYGARKTADGERDEPNDKISLQRIKDSLAACKSDYEDAKRRLKAFYGEAE